MRCKWQMCNTKAIGANSHYKSCHQLPTSWRTHAMRAVGLTHMRVLEEILSPSSSPKIGVQHMRAPCPRSECQDGTKGQRGSASKDSFGAWAGVQHHCRPWMNLQCRQQAPVGQRKCSLSSPKQDSPGRRSARRAMPGACRRAQTCCRQRRRGNWLPRRPTAKRQVGTMVWQGQTKCVPGRK